MRRRPKTPPRSSNRSPEGYSGYSDRDRDWDRTDRDWDDRERPSQSNDRPSAVGTFLNKTVIAVLAAALALGIGLGMFISSSTTSSDLGSIKTVYDLDQSAPDPELCVQYGASAVAVDIRAFLSFNPFNVYLSQPKMQPGCVVRRSNWSLLQSRSLINDQDVNQCRNRMNTFAYTGSIQNQSAEARVDCVYQNDAAGNLFLQPSSGGAPPETQGF